MCTLEPPLGGSVTFGLELRGNTYSYMYDEPRGFSSAGQTT